MKRRLMLLTTELHPAGAERIVFELATRLGSAAWDVEVVSLRSPRGDDGQVSRDLVAAGIHVTPLRLRGKLDLLGAQAFLDLVRRRRPDVLHAHLFHSNLAARLLGAVGGARRVVSTIHVVERRRLPGRTLTSRLTAWRDDATVCVSQAVARHAQAQLGVAGSRVRVIPNGVDLARFAQGPTRDEARAALDLPAGALLLGAVGRLAPQKGIDTLLEAFARLAPSHPTAHLVLAGQGPDEAALRARAGAHGLTARVRFLGHRRDVPCVLAALDLFCMPSRWEGFGLSLAEALAAGVPCVASDVDSLPEVLGGAGVLVPPDSPIALADALSRLLGDPQARADLAERAPAQAGQFEIGRMVDAYEALYRELLRRPE